MKLDDLNFVRALVKNRSGLALTGDKAYLFESRLTPVARKCGMKGLEELVAAMRSHPPQEALLKDVTEAMTTNESFFFRDIKPFDLFKDRVLPHLVETRAAKKFFRIWCAAASSGQEPYSLAMILKEEAPKMAGWRHEILGTDISSEMLNKAKAGLYSQFEVQRGLPIRFLLKHFKKENDAWAIDQGLRGMVRYHEFNLLDSLRPLGKFDVIFCRNVLIYFDPPTKKKVLDQIADQMPKDGLLFLGGSETVLGISEKFKPVPGRRGIYCLNGEETTDLTATFS